ncbi:MAG: MCE family protein [Rhodospirillales bacterium]|nr:MCE family protein [Rhodospirillales bacterium]
MRSSKINYLIVGLFVCVMIAALLASIAMLTGRTGAVDKYFTYYSNVTGIKFGTQVVYEGFPIGQLETITPEEKDGRMRFRVDFSVTQGWRIPEDSIVEIAAPGLLAAVTLAIHAGKKNKSLKAGALVSSQERSDVFAVVSSVAGQLGNLMDSNIKPLLTNFNTAVESINKIIANDAGLLFSDVRKTTNDLAAVAALMAERVPKIADNIEEFSAKMNATVDGLQKVLNPANREKLDNAISNVDAASAKVDALLDSVTTLVEDVGKIMVSRDGDMRKTISETRYIVESVSRHIDSINQNMEGAARNMYEFSRQIRQNPGLLLGSQAPEDKSKKQ